MPNNVIIVTNCGTDSHDYELLFKAYSVFPENLNEMHFKHFSRFPFLWLEND